MFVVGVEARQSGIILNVEAIVQVRRRINRAAAFEAGDDNLRRVGWPVRLVSFDEGGPLHALV